MDLVFLIGCLVCACTTIINYFAHDQPGKTELGAWGGGYPGLEPSVWGQSVKIAVVMVVLLSVVLRKMLGRL